MDSDLSAIFFVAPRRNPLRSRGRSNALAGSLVRVIASRDTDRRPEHFDILPDGTAGAEGIIDLAR